MGYVHKNSIQLLNALLESIASHVLDSGDTESNVLVIQRSEFYEKNSILDKFGHTLSSHEVNNDLNFSDGSFQVVFGDFPIHAGPKRERLKNVENVLQTLSLISDDGVGVYIFHSYYAMFQALNLRNSLAKYDFFVNAIINLPPDFWRPVSGMRPILALISKTNVPWEFVAELDEALGFRAPDRGAESLEDIASRVIAGDYNLEEWLREQQPRPDFLLSDQIDIVMGGFFFFKSSVDDPPTSEELEGITFDDEGTEGHEDLWNGILVEPELFKGFDHWKFNETITNLNTDYATYTKYKLEDLLVDLRLFTKILGFDEVENSVWIPLLGTQNCDVNLEKLDLKYQNICQVIVDTDKILPLYLSSYLNSDLGRALLARKRSESGRIVPKLNKGDVLDIEVPVPPLPIQKEISDTISKVNNALTMLAQLEKNVALNPISAKADKDRLDLVAEAIGSLSDGDKIKTLVRQGESKTLEFKETFSWDVRNKTRQKGLERAPINTMAAFLNTEGGVLLIGVNDDGKITGLDFEIEKLYKNKQDNFNKHFKDVFKQRIGAEFYPLIDSRLVEVDGFLVLQVTCYKSNHAAFIEDKDFYVRANPATDKLEGRVQLEYIQQHFH